MSQHSRDWKSSSIHFRRGKAQSLIFQLDLFIKTQQIFYIPRCGQRPPAGRPLPSSDPPWRAETGALVTNSQCEFLKKRTRSIAVTTDCPLSQSLIVQSTPRGETEKCKKTSVDPVYPRHTYFPAQYYREWIKCFCSGSQCQPPASRPPVAGHEVRAEVRQPGGGPCHSARRRGARGHVTRPDKHRGGAPPDRDGRREPAPSVCDSQDSKPLLIPS